MAYSSDKMSLSGNGALGQLVAASAPDLNDVPAVLRTTQLTPPRTGAESRPGSASSISRFGRPPQDSAILTAVRRQTEALEEKFIGQIERVQQQSERLRDAAFARVDSKMENMENLQPKIDKRVAELSGNMRGLSDEMQAQIRRVDQMDTRLWDLRHQLEEQVRTKCSEIELNQQHVTSAIRLANATHDDSLKRYNVRLARLEKVIEERMPHGDEMQQDLEQLSLRLTDLEAMRDVVPDHVSRATLESRYSDHAQSMNAFKLEYNDLQTEVKALEGQVKALRTRVETREQSRSHTMERGEVEAGFQALRNMVREAELERLQHGERVELLHKKIEGTEQAHDDLHSVVRRLQVSPAEGIMDMHSGAVCPEREICPGMEDIVLLQTEIRVCVERLNDHASGISKVTSDVSGIQQDMDLAPRIGSLVDTLKQVVPKVMDHEESVRSLHERIGHLEVSRAPSMSNDRQTNAVGNDAIAARVDHLDSVVTRIRIAVEGT